MTVYVSKSACCGRRPSSFSSRSTFHRSRLVARLLAERNVARVLVSPPGYGKSALAFSYADIVYSFEHCFWLNCASPCFLRDLDDVAIESSVFDNDASPRLVVFEDVPSLNDARAESFSNLIDSLIAHDVEVLVTCTPACDIFQKYQPDAVILSSSDLLLDDEELTSFGNTNLAVLHSEGDISPAHRVFAIAVSNTQIEKQEVLAHFVEEEMPAQWYVVSLAIGILISGKLDDLRRICLATDETLSYLERYYPHLGINLSEDKFQTIESDLEYIADAIRGRMEDLVSETLDAEKGEIAIQWADVLLANGYPERACKVVRKWGTRKARKDWILASSTHLFNYLCLFESYLLANESESEFVSERAYLDLIALRCLFYLGDFDKAILEAKRIAFGKSAPDQVRIIALLMLARTANQSIYEQARIKLQEFIDQADDYYKENQINRYEPSDAFWLPVSKVLTTPASKRLLSWNVAYELKANNRALALIASWVFAYLRENPRYVTELEEDELAVLHKMINWTVSGFSYIKSDCCIYDYAAALQYERARLVCLPDSPAFSIEVLVHLRNIENLLLKQQQQYSEFKRHAIARHQDKLLTRPSSYLSGKHLSMAIHNPKTPPMLHIELFGRFKVIRSGEELVSKGFRRQKVRLLLALLVLNSGRELSREYLYKTIWSGVSRDTARKNFYSIWAILRKSIGLPDETCPYLIRHQNGCSVNEKYVTSDVGRLKTICRNLVFADLSVEEMSDIYREIETTFADDLLPSETENDAIVISREEHRVRLVDALATSAQRLADNGHVQHALLFAREAIRRDRMREDAYNTLMRVQMMAGQRTNALSTFFACQKILRDELGIDPSSTTMEIYEELIRE